MKLRTKWAVVPCLVLVAYHIAVRGKGYGLDSMIGVDGA